MGNKKPATAFSPTPNSKDPPPKPRPAPLPPSPGPPPPYPPPPPPTQRSILTRTPPPTPTAAPRPEKPTPTSPDPPRPGTPSWMYHARGEKEARLQMAPYDGRGGELLPLGYEGDNKGMGKEKNDGIEKENGKKGKVESEDGKEAKGLRITKSWDRLVYSGGLN